MKLRTPHPLALGLLAVAACLAAPSCTPEEKHKWLATFFDGVPPLHPPEAILVEGAVKPPEKGTEPVERPAAPAVEWYEHEATEDKKTCSKCHDQNASFALLKPKRELCLPCHKDTTREHPRMHGPVAIADCLICHEAHQSPYKHLVRAEGPKLCLQCHDPTPSGGKTAGCERPSDEARCTQCHNPHGGKDAFFLASRQKGQTAVGRRQKAVGRRQTAVGRRQKAVGRRQTAVGRRQKAVGGKQKAVGRRQRAIGKSQKAEGRRRRASESEGESERER